MRMNNLWKQHQKISYMLHELLKTSNVETTPIPYFWRETNVNEYLLVLMLFEGFRKDQARRVQLYVRTAFDRW